MSAGVMSMNEPAPPTLPRFVVPVLVTAAVLALAAFAGNLLKPQLNRPVQALRIDGELQRLTATQIADAVRSEALPRLFAVDLDVVRRRVETLPWVAHARVSRIWPDRLAIRIQERLPYARWGENGLIDSESRVFTPAASELPNDLPQLAAPSGHEAETAATFQGLRNTLGNSAFVPAGLMLDARGEWRLATAIGIELRLGQDDPLAKTALLLGAIATALAGQLDKVAYVDLRYSNGFSVGWKDGLAPSTVGAKKAAAKSTVEGNKP